MFIHSLLARRLLLAHGAFEAQAQVDNVDVPLQGGFCGEGAQRRVAAGADVGAGGGGWRGCRRGGVEFWGYEAVGRA